MSSSLVTVIEISTKTAEPEPIFYASWLTVFETLQSFICPIVNITVA